MPWFQQKLRHTKNRRLVAAPGSASILPVAAFVGVVAVPMVGSAMLGRLQHRWTPSPAPVDAPVSSTRSAMPPQGRRQAVVSSAAPYRSHEHGEGAGHVHPTALRDDG